MTWSYSGDPSTTDRDKVRFLVGDTLSGDPLASNEEINWVLSVQPVVIYAAAAVADAISAGYSRKADLTIGATSIQLSQKATAYADLAKRLRSGGAGVLPGGDGSGIPTAVMVVGGLSQAEREAFKDDEDAIQPSFEVGKDDNPGTPNSDLWWRR